MNIYEIPAHPLEGKPAPVLAAGKKRDPCPACKVTDWWERPDGTAICGHCVRHTASHGPNSNGDYRWCPQCSADYWRVVEAAQKAARG